jgi:hypothetical protein
MRSDVNEEWENIKEAIEEAAIEALGTRCKNYRRKGIKIWNDKLENL